MRAAAHDRYRPLEMLRLDEVERPRLRQFSWSLPGTCGGHKVLGIV